MIYLALTSFIVFAAYLWIMAKLHGIQPSISDNYYVSRHPWMFTAAMWLVAFTMLPPMLDATPERYQYLAFLSCAGIIFVAAAAAYKREMTRKVHYAAAIISASAAFTWSLNLVPAVAVAALAAATYIIVGKPQCQGSKPRAANTIYWLETTAFIMAYLTYFIHIIIE